MWVGGERGDTNGKFCIEFTVQCWWVVKEETPMITRSKALWGLGRILHTNPETLTFPVSSELTQMIVDMSLGIDEAGKENP